MPAAADPSVRPGPDAECPCAWVPGRSLRECCGPLVLDGVLAPTPEALIRSRYTAFVLRDADHLWRTWHPRTRPAQVGDLDGVTWLALRVLDTGDSGMNEADKRGTVTFEASYLADDGRRGVLREHSRFERRAGRWFYVDGDELD